MLLTEIQARRNNRGSTDLAEDQVDRRIRREIKAGNPCVLVGIDVFKVASVQAKEAVHGVKRM